MNQFNKRKQTTIFSFIHQDQNDPQLKKIKDIKFMDLPYYVDL